VRDIREVVRTIHVDDEIKKFIIKLSGETRRDTLVKLGLSPRASQHLLLASQTRAFMERRDFVIPEDVIDVAHSVLAHRLILSAEARMENKNPHEIIDIIRARVPIPTGLKLR
jgi:MoxR-like ATPase